MKSLEKEKQSSNEKANILVNNFDDLLKSVKKQVPIFYFLQEKYDFKGEILELGAGSCWFSALVSKLPEVEKVYALDLSEDLLDKIGKKVIKQLEGNCKKIKFVVSDFHKMSFNNNKFDIIICDASLHHTQNLPVLLKETSRVLKNDGFLLAIREPIKTVPYFLKFKKFRREEAKKGSTENIYSKSEWKKHFSEAGFELGLFEEFNKNDTTIRLAKIPLFKVFNGILSSRYYLFAKKIKSKL